MPRHYNAPNKKKSKVKSKLSKLASKTGASAARGKMSRKR